MSGAARTRVLLLAVGLGALLSWGSWRLAQWRAAPPSAERPQRVVPFAPNLVEACYALGAGDRVVAVTDWTVWPPAALELPRVGGIVDPNLERLAALRCDLLVVQGENRSLREFARQQSVRWVEVKMDDDLASIERGLARLDTLLHGPGSRRAEELWARVRAGLDSLAATAPAPRPTVLLSMGHTPGRLDELFTAGAGSFLNELVAAAGGNPQYGEHPRRYFRLGQEALLARPPDIVLELRPGDSTATAASLAGAWVGAGLGAVRVAAVVHEGAMVPGPRVLETAHAFAQALRRARPAAELVGGGEG